MLLATGVLTWWVSSAARILQQVLKVSARAGSEERVQVLEQKNRQLQTIMQAFRAMTGTLDMQQAGTMAVEQVVTLTGFKKASLILGPDAQGDFVLAGARGLPDGYLAKFLEALKGPQKASSPIEWCQLTRQPVVVDNLARDFRTAGLREIYALGDVEGMIALPLILQDQFHGALIVYTEKGQPLSTSEISLVSALAGQAALTLENARQYSAAMQNRAKLDRALRSLESVASSLARTRVGVLPLLHHVAGAAADLYAPARMKLVISKAGRQAPVTVVEESGVEPISGDTLALSLPISLDGENFGRFDVSLGGEGRGLDVDEVRVLQSFAYLTASALGNGALVVEMRQTVEEMERSYIGTLEALSKALEMRDHETEGHSRRVVQYTMSLAQKMGVAEDGLVPILRGALLHDVGKIGIPDAILRKPGPLNEVERTIMREHPRIGYEMLREIHFLSAAAPVILHHHERYDGHGYPAGLAGDDIPLGARIFAVADTYDAMTSDRPYRKGLPHETAVSEILAGSGTQFDPKTVAAFLALPLEEFQRIRGGKGLETAS
jgi:putative nucleotidyltransferase with HDIG domain